MRVCLVARRFYESNTHMQQFARALANRGDTVDVLAVRRPGLPAYENCDGVNVYRIQFRLANEGSHLFYLFKVCQFVLKAMFRVGACHFRTPYDVVHVQSVPDVLVFSAIIPKLFHTPVILDLRDLVPELTVSKFDVHENSLIAKSFRFIEKCSATFANHVIVANPIWYERVVKRSADRSKCTMIWYSPDPSVFRHRAAAPNGRRFVMMYPGTLSWHQGVDIAVRALPKIKAAIPEAELHIYAEGSARESLAELAQRLNLGASVRFFDFIPTEALVDRMAQCDLALVPKRASDRFGNEAASTKIPEFMAVGVPVVASRTEIERRFFNESELCYFRSEDEDDLVRAVLSVHDDAALRERYSNNAARKIRDSGDESRQQYLRLVDTLVERNATRPRQCLP
jgi:glycosyltransferase involved in cell wall biosynthesis